MSDEETGKIVKNMLRSVMGDEPVFFDDRYLDLMSSKLCGRVLREKEISEKRSKYGALGGSVSKPKAKGKQKVSKTKANDKQTVSSNTNTNTNTNIKKTYGECANVYLTDEEHSKIVNDGLTGLIDELSFYIASKGDKYKSHYAVIKQWAMRRKREQAEKEKPKSNQFTQGVMSRDIDFTDLEKKLIKN
jgi:hypothetical protein